MPHASVNDTDDDAERELQRCPSCTFLKLLHAVRDRRLDVEVAQPTDTEDIFLIARAMAALQRVSRRLPLPQSCEEHPAHLDGDGDGCSRRGHGRPGAACHAAAWR